MVKVLFYLLLFLFKDSFEFRQNFIEIITLDSFYTIIYLLFKTLGYYELGM